MNYKARLHGASPSPFRRILSIGRNCCQTGTAERAAVLVDSAEYFRRLCQVLEGARRSIWIIGWDFDASIELIPGGACLGTQLRALVEREPELEIRILVWNLATIHTPSAALPLLVGEEWQDHPRIHIKLDRRHPLYASQHQKIVCVDGNIAFAGGMDLTVERWDTPEHGPSDQRRSCGDGTIYGPVHDLHMIVEGPVTRTIRNVVRQRWRIATREDVPDMTAGYEVNWPEDLRADFLDVPVAVSRTLPPWADGDGIHEVAALNRDALQAARKSIYIEAQYLAHRRIGDILCAHLRNPQGPEIVLLVTHITHGRLERWVMGGNRNRMIRRLRRADRYNRFRAFYPVVSDDTGECEILIHSKLIIIDDRFIRIGSSNLNRRSTGLDTECDLSIEAPDGTVREAITGIRNGLLAEHLGSSVEAIEQAIRSAGNLIGAIDSLNGGKRRLEPYADVRREGPTRLMFGTAVLDPREPIDIGGMLKSLPRKFYSSCVSAFDAVRSRISLKAKSSPPRLSGNRK